MRRLIWALMGLTLLAGLSGCAHFNTWSNAKMFFREAEETALDPQGNVTATARKKYDESISKCQKLIELYPNSDLVDDVLFIMSRSYFNKSEFSRSLRRLDELDDRFPEHEHQEKVLYMRGVCHLENGDESRAIAVLQRLEERFPQSEHLAEGIFRSGEAEFRLGSWQPAIDAYSRLLERFENSDWNDTARLNIAKAHWELRRDSLAVETLRELEAKGTDRRAVFDGQMLQAEILLETKRYEECRTLLEELVEVAENFQSRPQALLLQAKNTEAEGELETAVTLLENTAKEFPRSIYAAEAWYRIGLIRQVKEGDLELALEAYSQVETEMGRSLFTDLARTKKRALQDYFAMQEGFGEEAPDSSAAEMQFRLAENQWLRLEDPRSAVLEYQKILEQFPGSPLAPSAAYAIGYIQRYSLADTSAALAAVSLLRDRYPDSEAAAFVLNWESELGVVP